MTLKILSVRELQQPQIELLLGAAPHAEIIHFDAPSAAEIERALTADVEVLFTGRPDFAIGHASGLRWVQSETAGVDHFHGTAIWHSSVMLTSANGAHTPHTPEFVLAQMLSWAYRLPLAHEYQRQAIWGGGEHRARFTPRELRDQTLGIVGYGAIGREIARLAKAFGMRVLATRRNDSASREYTGYTRPGTGDPAGALPDRYFTLAQLPDLLGQSDIVVLAVPLSPRTQHLIGARELAGMRPSALLINIGRGGLVDQAALLDALARQALGGAVLDVTAPEPLPSDHPLWRGPNVVITPHVAGLSARYLDHVIEIFAENLRRYVSGEQLLNIVERELGY
jgi:phosphoglycerate dehydrogenase-like enzyme